MSSRTDIAYEEVIDLIDDKNIKHQKSLVDNIVVDHIKIIKQNKVIDKVKGDYITIDVDDISDYASRDKIVEVLQDNLLKMIENKFDKVLIVGLGNKFVTCDSLGPKVCEQIVVTNHLYDLNKLQQKKGMSKSAVVTPGVMGQTGIETAVIVKSICDVFKPDLVIAIDALATLSISRVNRCIQLSNTGIQPGSGVKNHRGAIDFKTLKVPVIAIGVATVVSIDHLVKDVLKINHLEEYFEQIDFEKINAHDMVVTPKGMDDDLVHLSNIISLAINKVIHPNLDSM